jgi:hypothetical protein
MTLARTTIQGRDQQILKGIALDLQSMPVLHLGAMTFSPSSLSAYVQRRIDLANAVETSRAAWLATVEAYDEMNAQANVVVQDLRNLVIAAFGEDSPKLADFGFAPPKRPNLSPEQKAIAAQKRNATRKARRTMGARQRAEIKGSVDEGGAP